MLKFYSGTSKKEKENSFEKSDPPISITQKGGSDSFEESKISVLECLFQIKTNIIILNKKNMNEERMIG